MAGAGRWGVVGLSAYGGGVSSRRRRRACPSHTRRRAGSVRPAAGGGGRSPPRAQAGWCAPVPPGPLPQRRARPVTPWPCPRMVGRRVPPRAPCRSASYPLAPRQPSGHGTAGVVAVDAARWSGAGERRGLWARAPRSSAHREAPAQGARQGGGHGRLVRRWSAGCRGVSPARQAPAGAALKAEGPRTHPGRRVCRYGGVRGRAKTGTGQARARGRVWA